MTLIFLSKGKSALGQCVWFGFGNICSSSLVISAMLSAVKPKLHSQPFVSHFHR